MPDTPAAPAAPTVLDAARLRVLTREFLAAHPPAGTDRLDFLRARFDAGLAWVHYPEGLGGLGAPAPCRPSSTQSWRPSAPPTTTPGASASASAWPRPPSSSTARPSSGGASCARCGPARRCGASSSANPAPAPTWPRSAPAPCPGTGDWVVDGQKVWTSSAHLARWAILIARTDPAVPKHRGITYFVCDMTDPGVEVRPLRQITGEAEFNEVFLTGVRIPDSRRLGAVGEGWRVAQTTLNNERVAIGGMRLPREGGMIGPVARTWRERPELRTHDLHQRLLKLWVDAEVSRLTAERLRQQLVAGQPGPEGAGMKLAFARLNQEISGLEVELLGEEGLLYDDWTMRRPELVDFTGREAGYRYLRSKGNSIEGGTSEVLLNIVAERVLGLPAEPRTDKDVAWKDLAR